MPGRCLVDVLEEVSYIRNVAVARYADDAGAGASQRVVLGLTTLAICHAEAMLLALQARNAPPAWVAYRVLVDHGLAIAHIAQDPLQCDLRACQVAAGPLGGGGPRSTGAPDDLGYALASAYVRGDGLAIALGDDLAPLLAAGVPTAAAEVLRRHVQKFLALDHGLATLPAIISCMAEIDARLRPTPPL